MYALILALLSALSPADVCERDLLRFPGDAEVRKNLDFAEAHAAWIRDRAVTHGWGWGLRQHAEEARALRSVWHHLAVARGAYAEVGDDARAALRQLRRELGPAAYYEGRMPPPAPFWRFQPRD